MQGQLTATARGPAGAGQVVDTQVAAEFMSEILAKVDEVTLASVSLELARKAEVMRALIGDGAAAHAGQEQLARCLRLVFSTRRHVAEILDGVGAGCLGAGVHDLLESPAPVEQRIEAFDGLLAGFPDAGFDLPGELLHFTYPERYWMWSRWMWDPRNETGALRLVTVEELDLHAAGRGAGYLRVGQALAFVNETGRAVGFTSMGGATGEASFGIDVFLASVYAIYMYTVLRMRMTQEFNRIVPELPDLVRRLLGVRHLEV
ncbi:MAG: hypothetical protein ACYDH5_12570 [Acidimicrobiales bacterium]